MAAACYVCTGKHCRKEASQLALVISLAEVAVVQEVRCQKICKGPVVGTEVAGSVEWFARVRKPKARDAIRRFVRDGGPVPERLRKRRVAKRSGLLRS